MVNKFLQFLGLVKKSGNLIEGYNKCEEILKKKKIYLFIFSTELSPKSKDMFMRYCIEKNIPTIDVFSKEDLGLSLGRSEINVLAVIEQNMAKKLIQIQENI
ncbi:MULTISPECIES: ribosomal L7Ae/L30e/S12e/Gadd45 family protein [Clostridium]|uniref:50S ribosomal protein L7/L12 n=2 Tax=Clostridium TaxID=1485 RepID=A0A9W6DAE6_9CLOT|nr:MULTISPECIES: ribosomal L7Ae/L30e/S12e/Gadd45 family protein [Clostridium]MBK1810665.1 ribosomal L7Ae/L30e/S12e/Gadd45 family protein [Clostridium yunnanense]GKU24752.1 50S ribosomal protein L7/L12 [Clostridium folliculivorans]GKU30850.1 50S ribosomal protein L7/L12 [Clostridium folliculivorans]